jgi:DNA-binding IclR family transcriptional regulator
MPLIDYDVVIRDAISVIDTTLSLAPFARNLFLASLDSQESHMPADHPERLGRSTGSRIAVIDKAVRVIDALVSAPSGLTPTDVAEAIASNRSTAFRLLTSLEQAGLLYRDGLTGRYRLGVKFLQYGESVRAGMALIDVAEPTLRRLSVSTRQSVSLGIREGYGARCVHRIPGPDVEVFAWKIGDWLPMHAGAAPQALLSSLSDSEIGLFLAHDEERRTRHGVLTVQQVREQIAATRRRGWSLNQSGLTLGVNSLGVVVRGTAGASICAISVAGLDHHYQQDTIEHTAEAVMDAAKELGRLLS